jgi:hypothetical protein
MKYEVVRSVKGIECIILSWQALARGEQKATEDLRSVVWRVAV